MRAERDSSIGAGPGDRGAQPVENQNVNEISPVPRMQTHDCLRPSLSHHTTCSISCVVSRGENCRRRKDAGASEPAREDNQPSMDDNGDKDQEMGGSSGLNDSDKLGLDEHWIQSTGFPLAAATFGPMANLLSICALVESWRVNPFNDNVRVADPPWALAINGLSLTFGIAANTSLLLTFLRRIPFQASQAFTLVAWLLSATLLLALIVAYDLCPSLQHRTVNDFIHSQSWYYGIMSTILYFLISFMLASNLWGAYIQNHYPPGLRGVTNSQRSLMLQSILYMVYLGGGAALFAHLEGWRFLDGIYWADYTLLTIGIGSDFSPKTTAARVALVPYAWGGIITVGLVVAGVHGLVIEKAKDKIRLRAARRRAVRKQWAARTKDEQNAGNNTMEGDTRGDTLEEQQQNATKEVLNVGVPEGDDKHWWWDKWSGLTAAFAAYLLLWLGGAAAFYAFESKQEWTYGDSMYFTNIALLTIGYGDLYPQSQGGKPFFVVWSLLAVPTVTVLISSTQDTIIGGLRSAMQKVTKGAKKAARKKAREQDGKPPAPASY